MILVTGATGNLGGETLRFLLKKVPGGRLAAIARNPAALEEFRQAGVSVRCADYEEPESLKAAFQGVETVVQIAAGAVDNPSAKLQENNVINAAAENGVGRILYTGSLHAHKEAVFSVIASQFETEGQIRRSGIPYTIFRNGKYMESVPYLIGAALQTGEIRYPGGDAKVSYVSRSDIAEALANVAAEAGHENRTYEITGPKAYSFEELAKILGEAQGLPISYVNCADDELRCGLVERGVPAPVAEALVNMAEGIRAGEFSHVGDSLEGLLKRKRATLEAYLRSL